MYSECNSYMWLVGRQGASYKVKATLNEDPTTLLLGIYILTVSEPMSTQKLKWECLQ